MFNSRSFKKKMSILKNVKFDKKTGFYVYNFNNSPIYIRNPKHLLPSNELKWACENLFYKLYTPQTGDVVIDLGAGYGEEAVWLSQNSNGVSYIGIEAQPVIYECLSNTYNKIGSSYRAYPFALTDASTFYLSSQLSYAASSEANSSYIYVPTISWNDFILKLNLQTIDLVKMNIEGAEIFVLKSIQDFSKIKRFIISCHDFRANFGDGDHFRTKKDVTNLLTSKGYTIQTFSLGKDWSDDWIFASR